MTSPRITPRRVPKRAPRVTPRMVRGVFTPQAWPILDMISTCACSYFFFSNILFCSSSAVHPLPDNWDYDDDPRFNRRCYVDRANNSRQTWVHPNWQSVQKFKAKEHFADYALFVEEFKDKMYEEAVDSLASLYLSNGDVQVIENKNEMMLRVMKLEV